MGGHLRPEGDLRSCSAHQHLKQTQACFNRTIFTRQPPQSRTHLFCLWLPVHCWGAGWLRPHLHPWSVPGGQPSTSPC